MKDVTVGKIISLNQIELSYIAGFLDGDGTVMSLVERHSEKRFRIRIRILIEFTQHNDNIRVLKYLRSKIGSGNINRSLRDVWKYSIKDQRSIKELIPLLCPYSVIKKRQMKIALQILSMSLIDKDSLLKAAVLSDKLSRCNLRSKSRKINGAQLVREMISRND